MKISIITITYNSEKTLEDTIQSVARQNYPDLEYIIVDGGSKDATLDIVKKYSNVVTKWIQIFFTIMQNAVCNVIANKYYPFLKEYTKETNLIDKKGLISDVKSMFVYKVSNVVVTSTDNILISMLLGTIYVGFYSKQ